MKNLEALGLDDGARGFKGLTHGVLVWQMLVGDEPEVAGGAQTSGGSGDAFFAAATAPASASADFSSADFFSSPSAAKQESSTPKASACSASQRVSAPKLMM